MRVRFGQKLRELRQKEPDTIELSSLSSKKPRLAVRGVFRSNNFVGDYTYTRFLMLDQGQWVQVSPMHQAGESLK